VFAAAAGFQEGAIAAPEAAAYGMKITVGIAAVLVGFAIGIDVSQGKRTSAAA
jgi:hypothetical protein